MKISRILLILLVLLLSAEAWAQTDKKANQTGDDDLKLVTARGRAKIYAGNERLAEDQALKNAQRNAIEQAVGLILDANTLTKNWQVIQDNVYTSSQGFITSYEVLNSTTTENGNYWIVDIKATVSSRKVGNILDALRVLHQQTDNRRYSMIYRRISDRSYNLNSDLVVSVLNTLQSKFTDAGFRFFEPKRSGDFNTILDDLLGRGIDYYIELEVLPNYTQGTGSYGLKTASVLIRAKVLTANTNEIITASEASVKSLTNSAYGSSGWNRALRTSTRKSADKLSNELINALGRYYSGITTSGDIYTLMFLEYTNDEEDVVKSVLREMEGFTTMREIRKLPGTLVLEYVSKNRLELVRNILKKEALDKKIILEAASVSNNRVVYQKPAE